jgi:hypothetical protein
MTNQRSLAKIKGVADLVILIDATGSMRTCIDSIKKSLSAFINEMTTGGQSPITDWRCRVVGYRDHLTDGDQWIVNNPFVSNDSEALIAQVTSLKAKLGGGDGPESLLQALDTILGWGIAETGTAATPYEWRASRDAKRVILLFTDALYHDENIQQATNHTSLSETIVTIIKDMNVELLFVAPAPDDYQSQYEILTTAPRAHHLVELVRPWSKSLENIVEHEGEFQDVMLAMAKTITVGI